MEIYWQNKDKNQVDVLVERTMKALIANNQSCAVIYDCDDEREDSQVLLDSGITTVDESQMFKIVFSPERVICEMPFYEKTEKETKSIIAAIKKFGETFLHDVIEIAKKKNDFVRAEVIRIVWKYFNRGNVIPRSSKNINEEQKLLLDANKEIKKTGSKSYIMDMEICKLIIKYAILIICWEKTFGSKSLINICIHQISKDKNDMTDNEKSKTEQKKEQLYYDIRTIEKNFVHINAKFVHNTKEEKKEAQYIQQEVHKAMGLAQGSLIKNDFFYLYNKNGDKDADRAKVTFSALNKIYTYFYVKKLSKNPQKDMMDALLIDGGFKDTHWYILNIIGICTEIVLMNVINLNQKLGFINKRDKQSINEFEEVFNEIQFQILPALYERFEDDKHKLNSVSEWTKQDLGATYYSKQKERIEKLTKADGYSMLGQYVLSVSSDNNKKKKRCRQYWKERNRNIKKNLVIYNKSENKLYYKKIDFTADRQRCIKFEKYCSEQWRLVNEVVTKWLLSVKFEK